MVDRSYLTVLPHVVSAKQRIIFESIGLAVQIMETNLQSIHDMCESRTSINPTEIQFTSTERARAISLAWGIVDQLDLIRRLVKVKDANIAIQAKVKFLEVAETARRLRNWMDHIPERITNYLNSKEKMPPVHGAITFTYLPSHTCDFPLSEPGLTDYWVIMIIASAGHKSYEIRHDRLLYPLINSRLDNFILYAFDQIIHLTKVVADTVKFCDYLAERLEDVTSREILMTSVRMGIPYDDLMKPSNLLPCTAVISAKRTLLVC